MKKYFEIIHITRSNFTNLVNGLSIDQLNKIPEGFNNNIAWNFGHIVVTTQGLCYRLSGLPLNIDAAIIDRYKKGTKPEQFITQAEIDFLKAIIHSNIDQLEVDYNNGIFTSFSAYTTSFNTTLNTIEDAIAMIQSHDALHYGYALAQRKLVLS
ncbi:DinB family protein [Niabella insulamsoli]|uniref:DinB family protein n=1 Tax=Niabella insulamsoli TaxID=3144874 RepID=UPI0031FCA77D